MSNSFMDKYFGPLPQQYCALFYATSIIMAFLFVMSLASIIYVMVIAKKTSTTFIIYSGSNLLVIFIAYIQARLLNTMCVKSI